MYQYFCDRPVKPGDDYIFTKEQAHHARDVVRLSHETVRLVYDGRGYFADCYRQGNDFVGHVLSEDPETHELDEKITLAAALIRREKFELVLQKAAEMGVSRIVPFESSRCVVHARSDRSEKQLARWREIVSEAARQCKRSRIPEVVSPVSFGDLGEYRSDINAAAYEKAGVDAPHLSALFEKGKSVTVVIGPEGGFSEAEADQLQGQSFIPVTLGSRILRAETAAMYACAVLAECSERSES
jgi:16S rRNA (uracil1498-N3)-methyltransferase